MTEPIAAPPECTPALRPSEHGGWDLELRLAELGKPLDFAAIFGRSAPTIVEVGCGSGIWMATEAERLPGTNFLGVEKEYSQVARTKDKFRRRGLLNTRIVHCDALYFLEEFPGEASVDGYVVLFSDPWPKKRHHKRRFFQPRLLPILERTLKPGAPLTIKTDVTEYYEVMIELFRGAGFLELEYDRRLDLEPDPADILTNFQRKAVEAGHPLHAMQYRRR